MALDDKLWNRDVSVVLTTGIMEAIILILGHGQRTAKQGKLGKEERYSVEE